MAQTRAYRKFKEALSRTDDQRERKKLFRERDCLIEQYQLRKFDICRDTIKYRQYFKDHTDSPIVQNLANEVWQAIDNLIHGRAEQVHFKQPVQMKSLAAGQLSSGRENPSGKQRLDLLQELPEGKAGIWRDLQKAIGALKAGAIPSGQRNQLLWEPVFCGGFGFCEAGQNKTERGIHVRDSGSRWRRKGLEIKIEKQECIKEYSYLGGSSREEPWYRMINKDRSDCSRIGDLWMVSM